MHSDISKKNLQCAVAADDLYHLTLQLFLGYYREDCRAWPYLDPIAMQSMRAGQ